MSLSIDLKACAILEHLLQEFDDGNVDYCCTQDLHQFRIERGGMHHQVGFFEQTLEGHDVDEIEDAVTRLAEDLKASNQPRSIRIGALR